MHYPKQLIEELVAKTYTNTCICTLCKSLITKNQWNVHGLVRLWLGLWVSLK